MHLDDNHASALMQVYADICFKMEFEDKISLTSDLVLLVDDVNEYRYSLSQELHHSDKDAWLSNKHDVGVQTDSLDDCQPDLQNENGWYTGLFLTFWGNF